MAQQAVLTQWSIAQTLDYLQKSIGDANRNEKQFFQAIQYLASKLNVNDNIVELLQSKGLDLVFDLMSDTLQMENVNLQKGLCTILIVCCSNAASKQFPAQKNGFDHLANQLKKNMADKDYSIYVCNAVCNVCHNNPPHREFAINSTIIRQIIAAMNTHRGQNGGEKVHETGCMALRNIASDARGMAAVGADGVKAITDGVDHYFDTPGIIKSSMGVLCNLCVLGSNGKAFIENGSMKLWNRIYDASANQYAIRLGCAMMIHNLASQKEAAVVLAVNDDALELIIGKIFKDVPCDSDLFNSALKALAALMFTLPTNAQDLKVECMNKMLDKGLLVAFNNTLKQSKNPKIEELIAMVTVSIVQTTKALAQKVADGDTPEFLVGCLDNPTAQTRHCCLTIWFHITDHYGNQVELMKAGIIEFFASQWYNGPITEDTLRVALSVLLKFVGNTKNYDTIRPHKQGLYAFAEFCKDKSEDMGKLCKSLKEDLDSIK